MSVLNSSIIPVSGTTSYEIENSLRFNDNDSAYLSWTPSSAGNRKTWTLSGWFKRGNITVEQMLWSANTGSYKDYVKLTTADKLFFVFDNGGTYVGGTASPVLRDPSAWYHLVIKMDTSNQVFEAYLNGETVSWDLKNSITLNYTPQTNSTSEHRIGQYTGGGQYLDGYLAEVNFIDGQALDPSNFGETGDYGEWKPIEYTGTYGTNGFYLPFTGNGTGNIADASGTSSVTIDSGVVHSTTQAKFGVSSIYLPGGGNANANSGYGIEYTGNSSNCPNGSNNITFEAWVYFDGSTAGTLWHGHDNGDWYMPRFSIKSTGKLEFGNQSAGGSNLIYYESTSALPTNQWAHIACTVSSKTVKFYIDGSAAGSRTWTTGTWGVPGGKQMVGVGWSGYIDEIRISNSIRYTTGFTPATTPFTSDSNTKLLIHSDYSPSTGLFADMSGNTNNWTGNNLTQDDQMLDSPTNNFCTINPLTKHSGMTYSEGNLYATGSSSQRPRVRSTWAIPETGKWYWEVLVTSGNNTCHGVTGYYRNYGAFPDFTGDSGIREYDLSYADGSILGFTVNRTTGKLQYRVNNGSWADVNFGSTVSTTLDIYPMFQLDDSSTHSSHFNFGQDSSFAGNKTAQGNADGNGYGDFYYTPPTGYLALCTKNLPDPAVVPSEHFNTVLYTGTGSTQSITGVGFQPDLVWNKRRSGASNHAMFDAVRGATKYLSSSQSSGEGTYSDSLTSFDTDGFTFGADTSSAGDNGSGTTGVSWNWKANGSGSSNTDGSITSTVSANTDAGFSIVSYTGNGTAGATVGHGLSQAPEFMLVKNRDGADNWLTYHSSNKYMILNLTNAENSHIGAWNNTNPTSSVFSLGTWENCNENTEDFIAYCFHSVDGYSKVGSYTGNGNADGPFVYTGFRPAFVMVKRTDAVNQWMINDSKRDEDNPTYARLWANLSNAEDTSDYRVDLLSNGFKCRQTSGDLNASGGNYIYLCFASNPFKHTNAR